MKTVFTLGYGNEVIMSIKDAQVMLDLLSRSFVCKREGYGDDAKYIVTNQTVEIKMINDHQLTVEEEIK